MGKNLIRFGLGNQSLRGMYKAYHIVDCIVVLKMLLSSLHPLRRTLFVLVSRNMHRLLWNNGEMRSKIWILFVNGKWRRWKSVNDIKCVERDLAGNNVSFLVEWEEKIFHFPNIFLCHTMLVNFSLFLRRSYKNPKNPFPLSDTWDNERPTIEK